MRVCFACSRGWKRPLRVSRFVWVRDTPPFDIDTHSPQPRRVSEQSSTEPLKSPRLELQPAARAYVFLLKFKFTSTKKQQHVAYASLLRKCMNKDHHQITQ